MKFLKTILALSLFLQIPFTFAWVIDHFDVSFSKTTVISWEAVDLTIKAFDENDNVVTDYEGTIVGFSESDPEAELPAQLSDDEWYTFKLSDEWIVKFENAMIFITTWEQELSIYSDDDDYILWQWIINVEKESVLPTENIEIISPLNWVTLWKTSVSVSWESKKNYEILIVLNDEIEFTTSTNSDWIFEKEITGLENEKNLIQAFILNSDQEKIWESNKIIVNINSNTPVFKKITLSPLPESWEIETWKNIIVDVYATKWLNKVAIIIDDAIVQLAETEDWVYTGNFNAPLTEWEYAISVSLKDLFWHSFNDQNAASIIVKKVELTWAPIVPWNDNNDDSNNDDSSSIDPVTIYGDSDFKITWLRVVKLKNKSVLTWDKVTWATWYNIYKKINEKDIVLIESITEPKYEIEITWDTVKHEYFAIKAIGKEAKWESFEWDLSQVTEIQTWPEIVILILMSLLLGWAYAYYKRREA